MALNLKRASRDENGNLINGSGLTLKEFRALMEYEEKKESGKATQSYNAAQINSGKTRDQFDSDVRNANKEKSENAVAHLLPSPTGKKETVSLDSPVNGTIGTMEKPASSGSSVADYLPLPGNEEEKKTITLPSPAQDRSTLKTETVEIEEPERREYYTLPDLSYTDEEKKSSEAVKASEVAMNNATTLATAAAKMVNSRVKKYEEIRASITECEKKIDELEAQYNASPSKAIAEECNALIDTHTSLLGELDNIQKEYDKYLAEYGDILQIYDSKYAEYTAQQTSFNEIAAAKEKEYKKWRATIRSPEEIQPEAEALDRAITAVYEKLQRAENRKSALYTGTHRGSDFDKLKSELATLDKEIARYEAELSALKNKYDLTSEELSVAEEIEKAEYYASYTERADFAKNSRYENTFGKGTPHDYSAPDSATMTFEESLNTVYGDIKYDYINGDDEARAHVLSYDQGLSNPYSEYDYMKPEEISIYNYIHKTEGKEAAESFLADLMGDLTYRQMTTESTNYKEYADKHPILGSAISILTNTLKPITAIGQLGDYLEDGEIDQNARYNRASYLTSALREGASADMNGFASFLYQTGMSLADFATVTALTGGTNASLAIMGMSSAADTVIEAKDRGLSDGQAITLGAAAGLIEAATEKIGLDELMNSIGKGRGFVTNILRNAGAEAHEELLSSIGNDVVDALVAKDRSAWNQAIDQYMKNDVTLTREQAWAKVFGEHLVEYGLAYLGGGLSGVAVGTGGSIPDIGKTYEKIKLQNDLGKILRTDTEGRTALINAAKALPDTSKARKLALDIESVIEKGKIPTASQLSKLDKLFTAELGKIEKNSSSANEAETSENTDTSAATDEKTVPETYEIVKEAKNAPLYTEYYKLGEKIEKSGFATAEEMLRLEELWQARQKTAQAIEHVKYAADGGNNSLDTVEEIIRSEYSIDTISYAEIEDAYNEAVAVSTPEDISVVSTNHENNAGNITSTEGSFSADNDNSSTEDVSVSDIAAVDKIKNAIPELSEMDSVISLTGNEFPKSSKKLTEQVGEFFASLKNKITRKGFGEVVISNDGIKSSIAHGLGRAKAVTFAAVPDVIASGKQIDYQENWKGRGYNTYIFAAPVQIGEKTGYVGAVVTQSEETNKYYLHEVVDSEGNIFKISKDADLFKTGSFTDNSASTSKSASSDNIISQKSDSDNTFDENNSEDLDTPTENEVTKHIEDIADELSWRNPGDVAINKFYADESAMIARLKAEGTLESHPLWYARGETARSGYVYGASESEIAIADRLSKALGRDILFFSEYARNENIKNGVLDRDVIWINVKHHPSRTVTWIIAHELTHTIENTKAYDKLKDYVFDILGEEEVKRQRTELLDLYDRREIDYEIVSNYVADHLLTDEAAIIKLVQKNRSLGQKIKSILANILDKLGVGGKKTEEYLALEKVYKTYQKALAEQASAQNTDGAASESERAKEKAIDPDDVLNDDYIQDIREQFKRGEITQDELNRLVNEYFDGDIEKGVPGKAKYSIVNLDDGRVYVQASRNVIKGKTLSEQRKDITQFFSDLLDKKSYLDIPTIEGDVLTITKDETANKARDNYRVVDGKRIKLTDNEFLVKLHIESHIDEIAEVSTKKSVKSDSKNHSFAKDGFTYRRAYFKDFDGKYYEVTLSIGNNGTIATVYNVGKIEEGVSPSAKIIAVVGSKPLGRTPSANSVSKIESKVNTSGENNFPFSKKAQNSMSNTPDALTSFADKTRLEYLEVTENLNPKSREYLERREREFVRRIGEVLHLSPNTKRGIVRDVARGIIAEQIKNGAVTEDVARDLFEYAYNEGVIKDNEYYNQYKELKNYLRNTAITISKQDRSDLGDWKAFKQSAQGKLKLWYKNGLPVDSAYMELVEQYPELFSADITHPADQLQRMLDVANGIKVNEISLDEYFGENVEEAKEWMWNDLNQAVTDFTREIGFGKKYIENLAERMAQEGIVVPNAETLFETYKNLKKLRADASKAVARNVLIPVEENYVRDLLIGRLTLDQIPAEHYNIEGIKDVYEAKLPYEYASKVIEAYHNKRKSDQYARADELLEGYENWKTVKMGFTLSMNTMERNFYDMIKDTDRAQAMIDEYIAPIHKREAQSTRYKNKLLDKIRALDISQKVAKGNRDTEAAAVQFIGEAESHIMRLESNKRIGKSGGMTLEEWQKALSDFKIANPELDYDRINKCVRTFREIYNQLFDDMNKARMLNGYEPIDYRYAYFPHFHKDIPTGFWGRFAEVLGVPQDTQNLPATIAGMTENFKPGIRWLSAAQERKLTDTEYDCLEGFDRYIGGAADVIFHTESIQKLRSLANRIRYQASDDALRQRMEVVEANEDLSDEDKHEQIAKIAEGKFTLSAFVNELDEYTNLLAGKKSRADRQSEQDMGRSFYNYAAWLKKHFGANMIAGNIGSAMTNFIPIAQAAGITKHQMLKAMYAQIKSMAVDDGFADRSDFLTNRIVGTDTLSKKTSDKISDILGTPAELIDGFSSGTIVRALYAQAKKNGLSDAEAMAQANTRAAEIMADRSKGAMPTIFSRSNFLTGIFTQFQLEVANQYAYMFKDIPRYYSGDKRKMLKVIASLFKIFILSYLFNDIYEALVGRRAAFDPIDIVNNAIGDATGYQLPNMFDAIGDILDGEDLADVFKTEKKGVAEAVKGAVTDTAEELPFVGGLLGGGRIPISSALPDIGTLYDTFTSDAVAKKKVKKIAEELISPVLYILPTFGGGQVKKLIQGTEASIRKGVWNLDNDGNKQLKYPISGALKNAQSIVFGRTATREAREWIESGFDTLSAKETAAYQALLSSGLSEKEALATIQEYNKKAKEASNVYRSENGLTGNSVYKKEKIDALRGLDIAEKSKLALYRELLADDKFEDEFAGFTSAGLTLDDYLAAESAYNEFNRNEESTASDNALSFARWVNSEGYTAEQAEIIKETFKYFNFAPASAGKYEDFTAAGLDDETSYKLVEALEVLEPINGKSNVSTIQKAEAVIANVEDRDMQMKVLESVVSESTYKDMSFAYSEWYVPPYQFIEAESAIDAVMYEQGKTSVSQAIVEEALRRCEMFDGRRAALWQIITGSKKPENNPFDTEIGAQVYADLQKNK